MVCKGHFSEETGDDERLTLLAKALLSVRLGAGLIVGENDEPRQPRAMERGGNNTIDSRTRASITPLFNAIAQHHLFDGMQPLCSGRPGV